LRKVAIASLIASGILCLVSLVVSAWRLFAVPGVNLRVQVLSILLSLLLFLFSLAAPSVYFAVAREKGVLCVSLISRRIAMGSAYALALHILWSLGFLLGFIGYNWGGPALTVKTSLQSVEDLAAAAFLLTLSRQSERVPDICEPPSRAFSVIVQIAAIMGTLWAVGTVLRLLGAPFLYSWLRDQANSRGVTLPGIGEILRMEAGYLATAIVMFAPAFTVFKSRWCAEIPPSPSETLNTAICSGV
jgi:hypothetical protein